MRSPANAPASRLVRDSRLFCLRHVTREVLVSESVTEIVNRLGIPLDDWWDTNAESIQREIDNPQFDNACRVHDWRNYVPSWAVNSWGILSSETRLAIYLLTEQAAHDEEWD